jgi:hypothetical protein
VQDLAPPHEVGAVHDPDARHRRRHRLLPLPPRSRAAKQLFETPPRETAALGDWGRSSLGCGALLASVHRTLSKPDRRSVGGAQFETPWSEERWGGCWVVRR